MDEPAIITVTTRCPYIGCWNGGREIKLDIPENVDDVICGCCGHSVDRI